MANIAQLQGIPWHEEQIKRTCKNGSKYCVYNKNICVCVHSKYHHKKCVGKGDCEWFESKGNTCRVISHQSAIQETHKEINNMNQQITEKDDKAENLSGLPIREPIRFSKILIH